MTLKLPELCTNIFSITLTSLDVELIKWSVDSYSRCLTVCLEMCLKVHMEVFSYRLFDSVPETNSLNQVIAESVIGEGKSRSTACC